MKDNKLEVQRIAKLFRDIADEIEKYGIHNVTLNVNEPITPITDGNFFVGYKYTGEYQIRMTFSWGWGTE